MPVNTTHADYDDYEEIWQRCRDIIAGQDTVKEEEETYLPKPPGQDDDEYQDYLARAMFYNATKRTIAGLVGMVFRKEPEIEVPEAVTPFLEDITLSGIPMPLFARQCLSEVLSVGRGGILVDVQGENVQGKRRPYLVFYKAEQIINWRAQTINGDQIITLVVLSETLNDASAADEFDTSAEIEQYRVLSLETKDEAGQPLAKPRYRVRLYQLVQSESAEGSKTSTMSLTEDLYPAYANADALPVIPFVFLGPEGIMPEIQDPPLLDLVNVNISHYQTSADLEWASYFTAFPQTVISGYTAGKEEKIKLGGGIVWTLPDPNAKAYVVGGDAQNLSGLEGRLQQKQKMMATLGARLLEEQKRDAEAAETVRLRQAGEQSTLQTISNCVGQGLQLQLQRLTEWAGANPNDVHVRFNTEYVDTKIDPALLRELVTSVQAGKISFETFYANLIRGGLAREGITAEDERAAIEAETAETTL